MFDTGVSLLESTAIVPKDILLGWFWVLHVLIGYNGTWGLFLYSHYVSVFNVIHHNSVSGVD